MGSILLLGNGINRAYNLKSWDELIYTSCNDKKIVFSKATPYNFRANIAAKGNISTFAVNFLLKNVK